MIKDLEKLGFTLDYKENIITVYKKGLVKVITMVEGQDVYISGNVMSENDCMQKAFGVETEEDLVTLCRLVNGD